MKRAALYARVSTQRQKDEQTIDTQLNEIKRGIEVDGCVLIEDCVYKDEGWSGAILERPDLDRLRQDAREGKFDIVYVFDRGRLSRKFVYQEILIEELAKHNVDFKSLHDVNGTSPEEQLMGSVMGVFHEYERVKIAERFRLGKLNKVRNGNLLGYIGPYGYDYIPVKGKGLNKVNGRFVINEEEAEVVRMVFDWVGNECISLREVIRRLYDLKIPPKKQKRPNWTKGPVSRLLTNESYTGRHHYYKREAIVPKNPSASSTKKYHRRVTNKTSRRTRDKEEWLLVKIPRIVDDDLFERVQKQLRLNHKYNPRNKTHPYLVGGLIYCSCGERRVGDGPDGKKYYRCTARLKSFPLPARCRVAGVNVAVLDAVCWERLSALLTDPKLVKQQIARYMQTHLVKTHSGPNESEIKQNLKALELEESRYAKMYGQNMMSDDVYEERIKNVMERRAKLRKIRVQQDDTIDRISQLEPEKLVEPFKNLINNMDFETKQFTARKIVDKIVATKEEVVIHGFIPILDAPTDGKVKLSAIYRYRWPAQRRQIYAV
jgi:site-specific DNA recombinase